MNAQLCAEAVALLRVFYSWPTTYRQDGLRETFAKVDALVDRIDREERGEVGLDRGQLDLLGDA